MKHRFLNIVFLLWLYGCSGGISGTGDGGPVTPVDGNTTADIAPDTHSPEGTQMPFSGELQFPQTLLVRLPATLDSLTNASTADANDLSAISDTPGVRLREQLTASDLDTIAIRTDLLILQSYYNNDSDSIENNGQTSCATNGNSDCEIRNQQLELTISPEAAAFSSDQLAPYSTGSANIESTIQANAPITFFNVSLQSRIAGHFDYKLQYTRENGSKITLQWTEDQLLVSVLAENVDTTLYSLLEADRGVMTLRRTDHLSSNATVQLIATGNSNSNTATYIEADLNGEQYIRAVADANTSALFSQELSTGNESYREAVNPQGQLLAVEVCEESCSQWRSLLPSQVLPDNFFSSQKSLVNTQSESTINPIEIPSLPQNVREFVVTVSRSADAVAASPDANTANIVCAGLRVPTRVRSFCWQPTPFDSPAFVYEQNRANGVTTYRLISPGEILLPQNDVQ